MKQSKHAATSPVGTGEVFPFVNRWRRIPLPGELHCIVRVDPVGIQAPSAGNDLLARYWIGLPAKSEKEIPDELAFGSQLKLCGFDLDQGYYCWGSKDRVPGYRVRSVEVRGATWREALTVAEKACIAEVGNLRLAMLAREAALASEGCEYYRAARLKDGAEEAPRLIPAYVPAWQDVATGTETTETED